MASSAPSVCPCDNIYSPARVPQGYTSLKNYHIDLYRKKHRSFVVVLEPKIRYHLAVQRYEGDFLAQVIVRHVHQKKMIATNMIRNKVVEKDLDFTVEEQGVYYIEYTQMPQKQAKVKYYCGQAFLSSANQ
jgi:hypothetical protein